VTNFDDLSKMALALPGTPIFGSKYDNFAPRVGIAFQVRQQAGWETVLRGGFGVFYDLATQEVGTAVANNYPFGANKLSFGGTFPLSSATAAPPPSTVSQLATGGTLAAFDPNLQLPYTLQWNAALEQSTPRAPAVPASGG